MVVSSEPSGDIPYKEPVQPSILDFKEPEQAAVVAGVAEEANLISQEPASPLVNSSESTVSSDDGAEDQSQTLANLLSQLSSGLDALKGLNLDGFRQIYPVFLAIFGAVVAGIVLSSVITVLNTVNHFPLVGGLLHGVFEFIGLIVFARFVSSNLLLQQRRAELFARIALLKKELLGPPKN